MSLNQTGVVSFNHIDVGASYDNGPGKHRIGLLALSNDYVMERDFINMRPSDDVVFYTSRLPNTPDCTVETLKVMAPHISTSTSLLIPEGRLDVVAYGCTSGTAVLGYDEIEARIQTARPGISCTTPLTASVEALDKFWAKKIAVLTPYVDDVNAEIARYLREAGKEIVYFNSFNIAENELMAKLSPQSIFDAAIASDHSDADALFISCTAIRACDVVERIEQKLGKPVVTAVQAIFWRSLRLSGYSNPVPGYGRLMRDEFVV
ncbi:MAG: maleate isomerase [Parasphingorhabdus sp.]|jgi:maleate isomerase